MGYTAEQMRAYMAQRRARIREELTAMLGGRCARCGSTDELEFDHVDPATKLFSIASGLDKPRAELLAEVAKCQLLCGVHHREKAMAESQGIHRAGSSQARGERNGRAKVTEDIVRAIQGSSLSHAAAAREFGTALTTVKDIRARRTWGHVA